MKKIDIAEMKTMARIETNAPKIDYGSGKRGAGYLDTYAMLREVRGKFKQFSGQRVISGGDVVPAIKYRFITRFDLEISNAIDKQMRFIIDGKTFTLDNWEVDTSGREFYLIFTLLQFGK
jgi:hypothetical protein